MEDDDCLYMLDSSDKDGKCEVIMDYTISWTLRRAQAKFKNEKPILYLNCRKILCKLLELHYSESIVFEKVEVWKQYDRIDLWVEVTLVNGNHDKKSEKHGILIENKYYTGLHETRDIDGKYRNQLIVYQKKFDSYYKDKPEWKKHYVLITCLSRENQYFPINPDQDKVFGFNVFSRRELLDKPDNNIDTESDIFNEFWFREWA